IVIAAQVLPENPAFARIYGLLQNQDGVFAVRLESYWGYLDTAFNISPIGLGTGATSLGARYVLGDIPLFVEFSLAKVVGDLSVVGLFVYLWMFAALVYTSLRALRVASWRGSPRTAD